MDMTHPGFHALHIEPARAMQRAIAHCAMLRRAFHLSLSRRSDASQWEFLETAVVAVVEQTRSARLDTRWYVEANERLKVSVFTLLKERSSKSSRPWHYRRAADQVYESTATWSKEIDELTLAYLRHSALIWVTLWHIADVQDLTATQAKERLDFCFESKDIPRREPEARQPKEKHWSFAGALWKSA